MRKTFKKDKKSGFTLVELLVVISIIGLLSSVVMVGVQSAKTKAQNSKILSEVRQIKIGLQMYYDSNRGYPNPLGVAGSLYCIGATTCISPLDNVTVISNYFVLNDEINKNLALIEANSSSPLAKIISTDKAEAASYTVPGMSSFTKLTEPVVYQCTVATNPCPEANSWVWYKQKSGSVTTWVGQSANSLINTTTSPGAVNGGSSGSSSS